MKKISVCLTIALAGAAFGIAAADEVVGSDKKIMGAAAFMREVEAQAEALRVKNKNESSGDSSNAFTEALAKFEGESAGLSPEDAAEE
ncbi:MAG: hypothetical protein FWG05_03095 [Kiritimatiellaeota bacterium]|nr:hypothetical protein [Kiritimatiellota bacterium]